MDPRIQPAAITPTIVHQRRNSPPGESLLVAITGIDAAGKGFLSRQVHSELVLLGLKVATLTVDDWLNLPCIRFHPTEPGRHFYRHAIRFDEMFSQLVLPLKRNRSISLDAQLTRETEHEHYPFHFFLENIDVILLEGIFLLKKEFRPFFDLTFWIDCSFKTALERAIRRGQEGLSPEATTQAFETIYFPAQHFHFENDAPQLAADWVVENDFRHI